MSNTIFKKENSNLFTMYGYGVENIQYILHSLGYEYNNISSKKARHECIHVIEKLLEYDIIYVSHWGKHHAIVQGLDLDIKQTIFYIQTVWFDKADYKDFEGMISFRFKEWYLNKIAKEGINLNTNWDWFADKFVPNLENWIEENRPR